MNREEALKLYDDKFYEDVIKTHSITYKSLCVIVETAGVNQKYPQSQYLNKFKKSFLNWKMAKPIVSKDGCLGEREFMALMSLCNAVKKDTNLHNDLQSHQQKQIDEARPRQQLEILREMYGLKKLTTPIGRSNNIEYVESGEETEEPQVNLKITYDCNEKSILPTPRGYSQDEMFKYEVEKSMYGEAVAIQKRFIRYNECGNE